MNGEESSPKNWETGEGASVVIVTTHIISDFSRIWWGDLVASVLCQLHISLSRTRYSAVIRFRVSIRARQERRPFIRLEREMFGAGR